MNDVPRAVNLEAEVARISDHWSPETVAQLNGYDVLVLKVKGQIVWHSHPDMDELFYVLRGRLTIQLRRGDVHLGPGDLYVIPKGVEHRPVADEEVHLLLI